MKPIALDGLVVADLGQTWAGPQLGRMAADMGAKVIKIESRKRPDVIRSLPPFVTDQERTLENSGYFHWLNRNKLGITLDLTTEKGSELCLELLKQCDVLLENFSRGVMDRFGLDYESVKKVNPRLIYLALTALGSNGPLKDYVMYGRPQVYMSGLAHTTGYPDMYPHPTNISWGDPVAAHHAFFAMLSALHYRKKSGEGQYVELSQWEGLIGITPENIMDYTLNKRVRERNGNRHETMAPHNTYQTIEGELSWVSIAVSSEEEWQALCDAMGNPEWTTEEKFQDMPSRWQHHEELDAHIEEWTIQYGGYEITEKLQAVGVAAFPVLSNRGLVEDPHLNDREFFVELEHPIFGKRIFDGLPWKMSKTPGQINSHAPSFGQHNNEVFGDMLGMSQEEIDRLVKEEVIY